MDISTILLRILITFVLAALFGFERQRTHKPVGFGTFMFIAIGSCALTTVPLFLGLENPVPLFAAVVTSIGFLVAGALIRTGDKTFGFTTAASIWTFAILGLTIGLGAYLIAGITYILIWLVILIDFYFEKKGMGSYQQKLTITAKLASQKEVNRIIEKSPEQILLDSFNCFFSSIGNACSVGQEINVRKLITDSFYQLRKDDLTILLVLEKKNDSYSFEFNIPYLIDGLIQLDFLDLGVIERRTFIPKMRWTNQFKESKNYEISSKGIEVIHEEENEF